MSDSANPWTIAHQTLLSMEFFRQKYWNSLPFPNPGNIPDPGIQLASPACPELAGKFFYHSTTSQILKSLTLLEIHMYFFPLYYGRGFSFLNSDSMFSLLIFFLCSPFIVSDTLWCIKSSFICGSISGPCFLIINPSVSFPLCNGRHS